MRNFKFNSILLIDDNEVDQMIHSKIIKNLSLAGQIIIKHSAIEALEFLAQAKASSGDLPEIILLDINMPLMSGLEFLKELDKRSYNQWLTAKIIVLSSTINKEEIARIRAIPYVYGFICKPLTAIALMQLF